MRAHAAADAEVHVVAPVLSSPLHRWTTDDAEDQALADALFGFAADEIVICLEEPERPHWLRRGVVESARHRFQLPVTEIDVVASEQAALA